LALTLSGGDGIRTEDEHDSIRLLNECLDPLAPILQILNLFTVYERCVGAGFQGGIEPIHEAGVPAGIGNEELGLRRAVHIGLVTLTICRNGAARRVAQICISSLTDERSGTRAADNVAGSPTRR